MAATKLGTGVLFTNTYKDGDKQPDMRGTLTIGEKEMQISAWSKTDKNGNPFYGLAVTEMVAKKDTAGTK